MIRRRDEKLKGGINESGRVPQNMMASKSS
jgi:hypothetical protein